MVGGTFFFVCMQDSAGTRGLPSSLCFKTIQRPHWHSSPCCRSHCCLFWVSGTLALTVPLASSHVQLLHSLSLSCPHVHVHLVLCLQFTQKSQHGLLLTKGKYLYLLGHFIHRPQLRCILCKIIFKLKQHSKYLI